MDNMLVDMQSPNRNTLAASKNSVRAKEMRLISP